MMWRLLIFVGCISWGNGQHARGTRQYERNNRRSWDIRLAVPGQPGNDYPTLGNIPKTSFSCSGKTPGYYSDLETNCQVFRVCTSGSTYGFQSFLCPNGTLFNQAVFVCDWWMNVNCGASQQFVSNNNDKFGNLKLGPQLMKDVKKMLTHPMRNPYDKSAMKSNLVVMQEYIPPSGQLFPNSALLGNADRTPSNFFVPPKLTQQNFGQNNLINENSFAGSTPSPTYVPAFNSQQSTQADAEVFQRQSSQYFQTNRQQGNQFGRLVQSSGNINNNGNSQIIRQNQGQQYNQNQLSNAPTTYNPHNTLTSQRIQTNGQNAKYTNNNTPTQWNSGKQTEFGFSLTKQPYTYKPNTQPQFSNEIGGQVGNQAKENLVSNTDVPSTVITKTLTFNRIIQEPKNGTPKSRIVFKTWIVKPSKSAKLIAEPTAYSYNRPTISEKQVDDSTAYVYDRPTTPSPTERLVSESEVPYVYNRPTVAAKQVVTKQLPRLYLTPSTPAPTVARLYLAPTTPPPTNPSRLYLAPTTFNPAARLYLPPSESAPLLLPRQYLAPNAIVQPTYPQQPQLAQLQASPTSPSPVYVSPTQDNSSNKPTFSLTKHSRINANHNNLTFADILTKEKLDITVNDIVKDTSKILKSTSDEQFGQLRQEVNSVDYPDETYLPPNPNTGSQESLTPTTIPDTSKSSRLIQGPSRDLEPPLETNNNVQTTNQLSNLPFFQQPTLPTNTIERTVSLKISIPEKVASYLFHSSNDSDFDRLEILNTGSSNYLVLTNQLAKSTTPSFIPIGKLIADKNSSLSNSQALVFSFLADSINVAKEYNNIAQQNALPGTSQSQFQNVNNDELARITNQISQLTSSQYSGNRQTNNFGNTNTVSTSQTTTLNAANQFNQNANTNSIQNQNSQVQSAQYNTAPQQTGSFYSSQFQSGNNGYTSNIPTNANQNQIYSGQLYQRPVPEVTQQYYNQANSANLIQATNNSNQNSEAEHLHSSTQNSNVGNNNPAKHSSAEVEIVKSQSVEVDTSRDSPAKLQLAPGHEQDFNSQENAQTIVNNFLNGNGISAQVQDNIVGTIPHPLEKNKLVTYKKDQSYYVYTKLDNNVLQKNEQSNTQLNSGNQNAKLIQNNDFLSSFQLIPSVSYQLEDEKEQQRILNAFRINEFGRPNDNGGYKDDNPNRRQDIVTSNVDYSINHPSARQTLGQAVPNGIYAGPSSYSAPQGSIGFLEARQRLVQNPNLRSRLEQFDDSNTESGYPKASQQFGY